MGRIPVCVHAWIEPQGEQFVYNADFDTERMLILNEYWGNSDQNPLLLPNQVKNTQKNYARYNGYEACWIIQPGGTERRGRLVNLIKAVIFNHHITSESRQSVYQALENLDIPQLYLGKSIPDQTQMQAAQEPNFINNLKNNLYIHVNVEIEPPQPTIKYEHTNIKQKEKAIATTKQGMKKAMLGMFILLVAIITTITLFGQKNKPEEKQSEIIIKPASTDINPEPISTEKPSTNTDGNNNDKEKIDEIANYKKSVNDLEKKIEDFGKKSELEMYKNETEFRKSETTYKGLIETKEIETKEIETKLEKIEKNIKEINTKIAIEKWKKDYKDKQLKIDLNQLAEDIRSMTNDSKKQRYYEDNFKNPLAETIEENLKKLENDYNNINEWVRKNKGEEIENSYNEIESGKNKKINISQISAVKLKKEDEYTYKYLLQEKVIKRFLANKPDETIASYSEEIKESNYFFTITKYQETTPRVRYYIPLVLIRFSKFLEEKEFKFNIVLEDKPRIEFLLKIKIRD